MWGDTRIGLIKSAPENIYPSEDLPVLPGAQNAFFLLSTLARTRGGSPAAAARDLILVEVVDKYPCQFVVDKSFPQEWLSIAVTSFLSSGV